MIQITMIAAACLSLVAYASFGVLTSSDENKGGLSIKVNEGGVSVGVNRPRVAQAALTCSPSPTPGG